jgi:hypothetical protein
MINTITPTVTPPIEMTVMSEIKVWRRRDFKYRRPTVNSYSILQCVSSTSQVRERQRGMRLPPIDDGYRDTP